MLYGESAKRVLTKKVRSSIIGKHSKNGVWKTENEVQKKFFLYIISLVTVTLKFSIMTALQFASGIIILNLVKKI